MTVGIRYSTVTVYLYTNLVFFTSKKRGKIFVVDAKRLNEVETATLVIELTFPLHMNVKPKRGSFFSTEGDERPVL